MHTSIRLLTAVDWDNADKRVALAQIMRLAGVPDDNCFLDQVAPKTERKTRGHDADRA